VKLHIGGRCILFSGGPEARLATAEILSGKMANALVEVNMPTPIVVPELGESVLEATVGHWRKKEGDRVSPGEVVVELETDKVDLEVGAEQAGVLARIERKEGEDVHIGDVLGVIEELAPGAQPSNGSGAQTQSAQAPAISQAEIPQPAQPVSQKPTLAEPTPQPKTTTEARSLTAEEVSTPSARRFAREKGLDLTQVPLVDSAARFTRQDAERLASASGGAAPAARAIPGVPTPAPQIPPRHEERIRMSRRRMTIAQRLVEAQHTAAMLTTFNEIDMSAVVELRKRQKDAFKEKYGVNLGITSFFVKACVAALKQFPRLNAEVQGDEMILKHYYDIGVAVGAEEGLVVPVLRDADRLSFAEVEIAVKEYARKAREGSLTLADLRGGTFSITNGGVFGSLLSTPILNPPQVGILGLHKIEERPVAVQGQVAIRPMMYVALSYDHRIVDGLEAVQFLARVKGLVEDPGTLLIES
jgi:2-oxoglutarate dehydrogenase E2 component (dihydrolipoamide succinyltransferase)